MPDRRFTSAFAVDRDPKKAFDAIGNIRGCGSRGIEGRTVAIRHRTAATPAPRPVAMTSGSTATTAAALTATLGLGILIIIAPSSIPGLTPPM